MEPVDMAGMATRSRSPMRLTVPLPNLRSICPMAAASAFLFLYSDPFDTSICQVSELRPWLDIFDFRPLSCGQCWQHTPKSCMRKQYSCLYRLWRILAHQHQLSQTSHHGLPTYFIPIP